VLGWWPSQMDFAMEGLAGSSAQQPPRLFLPPHVDMSKQHVLSPSFEFVG
jgi:hypothetical protein